jgi:hypothetical protein
MPALAPTPFSRHLRSFKKQTLCGCPPGPPAIPPWTGMGCCAYPMRGASADRGSPPPPCPAVRRFGYTALMFAARNDHHEIVEQLVVARADLNAKSRTYGCALPPRPFRRCRRSPTLCRLRLRRPAGTQRCTLRRTAAAPNPPWRCSSAAPTGPSRTTPGNAVPPIATPTGPHTDSARIGAGERLAKMHKLRTRSPRTTRRWRRCGRRHRPRAPPSACAPCHATSRTQPCTDRALRPTPTHPRHDVRVGLRCIRRC